MRTDSREEHLADKTLSLSKKAKNVKERIGLGGMDADRIREIMGEAPACPRKRRGTSGNDIIRPARKNGPMQPSVYGEEYLHGIAGVQKSL